MSRQLADKLRVQVLRRHIVKGLKGLNRGDGIKHCVVAEALRERFPRRRIEVGFTFAEIGTTMYSTTLSGERFIERAVDGKKVNPTTITLTRRE